MADVAMVNGVLVPADSVAALPADGAFVSVVADEGVCSGWLVLDADDRAEIAGGQSDRPVIAAVVSPDGTVAYPLVRRGDVQTAAAPGGASGTWLSERELSMLRAALAAQRAAVAARRRAAEDRQKRDEWLESLVCDAHEWADRNSLCGEFDRFMEEHGLPGRARDYSVALTVSVTVPLSVTVFATSEDDARERADMLDMADVLLSHMQSARYPDMSVDSYAIDDVEEM